MDDPEEIDLVFQSYFQELFTTSSPSILDIQKATKCVRNKVTPEMNSTMLITFTKEEVEATLM